MEKIERRNKMKTNIKKLIAMEKEPAVIKKRFTYRGRDCVIIWVMGHFNAYVETTLKGMNYSRKRNRDIGPDAKITCHGGLTYSGKLNYYGIDELKDTKKWYFGMDFAHAWDYMEWRPRKDAHKWKLKEVVKETKQLCDEVIKYEAFYRRQIRK